VFLIVLCFIQLVKLRFTIIEWKWRHPDFSDPPFVDLGSVPGSVHRMQWCGRFQVNFLDHEGGSWSRDASHELRRTSCWFELSSNA